MKMRLLILLAAAGAMAQAQDAREIIRKSIELDQGNWMRMRDYTWVIRDREQHLDASGHVKSEDSKGWESLILYGEPYERQVERDGKPLPAEEQRSQQEKLDKRAGKLAKETPEQRKRRLADYENERRKNREFLREIPDLFDFRLEGIARIDAREVWVISATPHPGYRPKHRDAWALLKIRG